GVMKIEESSTFLDERVNRPLLFGRHPHEVLALVLLGMNHAVAENHEETDPCEVFRRQGPNIYSEVRYDTRSLEYRSETRLEVSGLMWLVADQNQGVRTWVQPARDVAGERGKRYGQLPIHMLEVLLDRSIVGHPDERVDGEVNQVSYVSQGTTLSDLMTDLASELGKELVLTVQQLRPTPGAEAGDDLCRPKGLE